MQVKVYTDGGSRGNPGDGAAGYRIIDGSKESVYGLFLGTVTNNQAEYLAVIGALTTLGKIYELQSSDTVEFFLDSELIVKQLAGEYKIKDPILAELNKKIQSQLKRLPMVQFSHIPREKNKIADHAVNQVLDLQNGISEFTTNN